ncbi:hypothetical protein G3I19_08390 [Streptomyces sp. SID10853]|uniref:hypothetical protein n=1 Tax=Streptomyces sp. SID10853 TaxID=2706028 RepID=UPI0013C09F69|nr:hypothetical protein [Streptomyces sp. SID10853]NDZ78541.1 hypothetical protein [Streptomyces sp. SID10853]
MRAGQVGTKISRTLPPGRVRLAHVLGELYRHTGAPTLAKAVLLFDERGYVTNRDAMSRYLNGRHVPPLRFATLMHEIAVANTGSEAIVGLSRQAVIQAHESAEPTLCKVCPELQRENDALLRERRRLEESEAGLSEALANARQRAKTLPVPHFSRDRQRRSNDIAGARQIASAAAKLQDQGSADEALSMLIDTVGALTPLEGAASLVLLRSTKQTQLADTLVHLYGQEHSEKEVIQVALKLHDRGMADDAIEMLRTAAR